MYETHEHGYPDPRQPISPAAFSLFSSIVLWLNPDGERLSGGNAKSFTTPNKKYILYQMPKFLNVILRVVQYSESKYIHNHLLT